MQKLYKIVTIMLVLALCFTQNTLYAQKCCVECQADVKVVSDKQVLLEKIDIPEGTLASNISTNLYVSYRSGNAQKFWSNLVIATAGVAVSTQLNNGNLTEGKGANGISPLIPLGVSVATVPSIWKNRPRGVPQAQLWIQHRDLRGKLTQTWEQPISSEAKNSAELLTVTIDKPLTAGTLEVYLQNGSKNNVYYWGLQTFKNIAKLIEKNTGVVADKTNKSARTAGCPDGYLPNGQGQCCNPFNGECVSENQANSTPPTCYLDIYQKSDAPVSNTSMVTGANTERQQMENQGWELVRSIAFDCNTGLVQPAEGFPEETNVNDAANQAMNAYIAQHNNNNGGGGTGGGGGGTGGSGGCPSGFLPNGQGLCCNPFTGQCLNGGGGPSSDSNCINGVDPQGNPCYGGGGGNDCPAGTHRNPITGACDPDKIIDKSGVTTPCLVTAVTRALSSSPPSAFIAAFNELFTGSGNFNLTFVEENVILNHENKEVAAQCGDMVNNSVTIKLSKKSLPGTSTNYQIAAVLHEMMHAFMQAKGHSPAHEQLLGDEYFDTYLYPSYRNLGFSVKDAIALGLYGCSDLIPRNKNTGLLYSDSVNLNSILDTYNSNNLNNTLSLNQIMSIGDSYSNTVRDPQGNIISLGGSKCL
jgi:hypothetical protein